MAISPLPVRNSNDWYAWAADIDGSARIAPTLTADTVTFTSSGTLVPGARNAVNAASQAITLTLPLPAGRGQTLLVERIDTSTANAVSFGLATNVTLRGSNVITITMPAVGVAFEALLFVAESATSWVVASGHKTKAWLDALYAGKVSPVFTGTPTAPTPSNDDNSQALATTAFVKNQRYLTSAPSVTDATNTAKGVIQLTGDLGGTAGNPQLRQLTASSQTYGSASAVPRVTIDTAGRVTSVVEVAIAASGGGSSTTSPGRIYVDSYGAKGDGTTDDIAAIRSAIAALPNGGVLVFTPGKTYLTSDTVYINNKVQVTLEAYGAAIACTASTDTSAVVRIENCTHVQVFGGSLTHKTAGARKNDADGLCVAHCSNVLVMAVRVGYVYSIGIRIAGSTRTTVTGCTVNGSTADGIGAYGWQRQAATADVQMAAGSTTLTSAASFFQGHDVGSYVTVYGAAASGGNLLTTIVSVQSTSQVTLANAAVTAVSAQYVRIARPVVNLSVVGNHLANTGDDAISSVGYRTFASMIIGPNTDWVVEGNTILNGGARGIVAVGCYRGVISANTMKNTKQGGVFISTEPNVGGSWGCQDIIVDSNVLESINTDYGVGNSNYGAIFVNSIFGAYPVYNIMITNNSIRDAYSYYIGVGGDTGSNDSTGTQEIVVRGNRMVGGNRNNNAVQVIKSTGVTIDQNRIDMARTGGIYVATEVAGTVVVRDNVISNFDRVGQGFSAMSINPSSAVVLNNVVNGVNIASGTSGGGGNGPITTPTGLKTSTPPGSVTSGLMLWLEAENMSGITDGSAIASLLDGSGAGRNATQSTASAQPIYRATSSSPTLPGSKPFAFFDAADDFLSAPLPVTNAPMTIFTVLFDPNPSTGYRPYIDLAAPGASGTRFILNAANNGQFVLAGNGSSGTTTRVVPTTWFLATVILNGDGTASFWVNGTQVTVSGAVNSTGTHASSPGYVMNRYADGSPGGIGISRAIDMVYSRALTSTERGNVETALKGKYGIS